MQLNGRGLRAISGARIIRGWVGGGRGIVDGGGAGISRRHIAAGLDHTSEIGRRRDRDKIVSSSEAGDAVFAEIVGTLSTRLLPMHVPRNKSLPQDCDLCFRHGVAVFISDAA